MRSAFSSSKSIIKFTIYFSNTHNLKFSHVSFPPKIFLILWSHRGKHIIEIPEILIIEKILKFHWRFAQRWILDLRLNIRKTRKNKTHIKTWTKLLRIFGKVALPPVKKMKKCKYAIRRFSDFLMEFPPGIIQNDKICGFSTIWLCDKILFYLQY